MEIARELTKSYWKAVEAAKKALFGIQEEFLVGTRTALDAFDAQNELFISQTRWLNAKIDHLLYVVDFFKTAGKLDLKNFATRLEFEPEESEEDEGNENTEHQNEAQP
jgi:outer membrane protein